VLLEKRCYSFHVCKKRKRKAVSKTKEKPPIAGGKTNCLGAQKNREEGE
jgi:hypothetical protein